MGWAAASPLPLLAPGSGLPLLKKAYGRQLPRLRRFVALTY